METDLFAGVAVSDLPRAIAWYERLLGEVESFDPHEQERVWRIGAHGYVYAVLRPGDAGHGLVTLFVADLDGFLAAADARGVRPDSEERYEHGVRKALFHDPDGNEVGVGGESA